MRHGLRRLFCWPSVVQAETSRKLTQAIQTTFFQRVSLALTNSFQYSAITRAGVRTGARTDHAAARLVRGQIWKNMEFQEIDKTLIYIKYRWKECDPSISKRNNLLTQWSKILIKCKNGWSIIFILIHFRIDNLQFAVQKAISVDRRTAKYPPK